MSDITGPDLVAFFQSYSIDCYFRQRWIDKRLNFSSDSQKELALSVQG